MQISWALNFLQQQMARLWIIVNALRASDPYNVSYRPGRRLTDSQILTKETFNHYWLTLERYSLRPGQAGLIAYSKVMQLQAYLVSNTVRGKGLMSRLVLSLGTVAHIGQAHDNHVLLQFWGELFT